VSAAHRLRYRLVDFLGFTPLSHRPPLPKRWWVYCAVAYLAPSLVLQLVPATVVPYRDLIWLVTLVPAYVLSLHYGMRGAVAGLAMGTVLFTAIQYLVASHLEPEDWRVTVPIYTAYGAIAISVGWLSEQLHLFYERAIQGERVAVISQVAVAMRHEVNNALATILAEGQLLEQDAVLSHPEAKQSLQDILAMTRRIRDSIDKLVNLTHAPTTHYVEGVSMIDLSKLDRDPLSVVRDPLTSHDLPHRKTDNG
jgi:signal transduction histidine kinase